MNVISEQTRQTRSVSQTAMLYPDIDRSGHTKTLCPCARRSISRCITLVTAIFLASLIGSTAAMADSFDGETPNGTAASLDQQAASAQLADPTAPNSLRSHGHP